MGAMNDVSLAFEANRVTKLSLTEMSVGNIFTKTTPDHSCDFVRFSGSFNSTKPF